MKKLLFFGLACLAMFQLNGMHPAGDLAGFDEGMRSNDCMSKRIEALEEQNKLLCAQVSELIKNQSAFMASTVGWGERIKGKVEQKFKNINAENELLKQCFYELNDALQKRATENIQKDHAFKVMFQHRPKKNSFSPAQPLWDIMRLCKEYIENIK